MMWIALMVVLAIAAYLTLWPVRLDPLPFHPPAAPSLADGPYRRNDALAAIERVALGGRVAPETVAVGPDGLLYAGVDGGAIVRLRPDGTGLETFAETGGRPDGIAFDADGRLVVCDCHRGLLRIDDAGRIDVLAAPTGAPPVTFANDLAIARDGTVYFTCSSTRWNVEDDVFDILEHRPTGRLLAWREGEGVRLVADGLAFANGIALGPGEEYALVAETAAYRIVRIWLRGPRAGERDVFVDNLPGFPDNIRAGGGGRFWVAIASPRDAFADRFLFPRPALRKVLARLPRALLPGPKPYAMMLAFNAAGDLLHNLQDDQQGCFRMITCVDEVDGWLWIGSFREGAIGRLRAPSPDIPVRRTEDPI